MPAKEGQGQKGQDFRLFARAPHLRGSEGNGQADPCPVCVKLQKALADSGAATWSREGEGKALGKR